MKETIDDYFPSKYLKAGDIKGDTPATIAEVKEETMGDDVKPVIYFKEFQKGLVLNKTNGTKITQLAGSGILTDWTGKTIVLYTVNISFKGEEVPAIRVKAGASTPSMIDQLLEETVR